MQLPSFRLLPGGRPSTCSGWELIPGVTFSMVEGPGRFRLMVEGITHRDEVDERFAWLSAVDRAGGAVVVVIHSLDTPYAYEWGALAESGRARGGYMPVIRRSR